MAEGQGSLRLTFEYEGRSVRLRDVQPVDAVAPAPPVSARGTGGFALEMRDGEGQLLFRRMLDDPVTGSVELPVGDRDAERPFERVTVEQPSGTFVVMVPAVAASTEVALFDRREGPEEGLKDVQPLARFDLEPARIPRPRPRIPRVPPELRPPRGLRGRLRDILRRRGPR